MTELQPANHALLYLNSDPSLDAVLARVPVAGGSVLQHRTELPAGSRRLRSLAQWLEVSERTVYRDIRDLELSRVPVDGEAGVGYRLRKGCGGGEDD